MKLKGVDHKQQTANWKESSFPKTQYNTLLRLIEINHKITKPAIFLLYNPTKKNFISTNNIFSLNFKPQKFV